MEPELEGGGGWSFVVLPDTQILAASHPEIFTAQTRWIAEESRAWNVQFVAHVGDVVDDNSATQWGVAFDALRRLDGHVPYVLAVGNHDLGPFGSAHDRSTLLNDYFPLADVVHEPWFGGAFEADRRENTFATFETPTGPWLVLSLEFGPRSDVLAWADAVLEAHRDQPTLVVTHAYLYADDTRYDHVTRLDQDWSPYAYGVANAPEGVNDGEEMFQRLIRRHDQVELVVCGHVLHDGLGRRTSLQDGGGRVHELLANYQHRELGGAGFLRIFTVSPWGDRVHVQTYSPYLGAWRDGPDESFVLDLDRRRDEAADLD
ncbi:MAG: metallophosphoesterase [Sandaracinus sp.]|nr:metallophosphoesterase [Sandaracinus sp.]